MSSPSPSSFSPFSSWVDRIQEGIDSLAGYADVFHKNVQASGVIPQVRAPWIPPSFLFFHILLLCQIPPFDPSPNFLSIPSLPLVLSVIFHLFLFILFPLSFSYYDVTLDFDDYGTMCRGSRVLSGYDRLHLHGKHHVMRRWK
jgi:hypothetical protein